MKKILIILTLLSAFLITEVGAQEELQPIDYSLPVIQAVVANQKARLNKNPEIIWKMLTKKMQEFVKDFNAFSKQFREPKPQKRSVAIGKAQLVGIRFIGTNRAWVEIAGLDLNLPRGFYLIKEDGEWKFAVINVYVDKVKKDINSLGKAIKDYYEVNKRFPDKLSDLLKPVPYIKSIPIDLFNDNDMPYVYKVIDETKCILYSFGPNSKDDDGAISIDWSAKNITPLTDGDIVWSFSPNNG